MQNIGQNKRDWGTNNIKMENNEFKKVCIKNRRFWLEGFDFDNILIDEKSHENILIYDISYKTLNDGTRYLVLFCSEKYDVIYDRIRYLISLKSSITYVFFHHYEKTNVDSYDSLAIEETLTLHNVIRLIILSWISTSAICLIAARVDLLTHWWKLQGDNILWSNA